MRVLFLDVDGVLNRRAHPSGKFGPVEPRLVERLNGVLEVTRASVVVSSDWRACGSAEAVADHLLQLGVVGEILGKTGHLGDRAWEIKQWLLEFPTATKVAVLDDQYIPPLNNVRVLVQTDPRYGIRPRDVRKLVEALGEKRPIPAAPWRCPHHSRAWGCQCELHRGHPGFCQNDGDCFWPKKS